MKLLLANPRGFCAGVDRAIAIVEQALESFGAPIYVRHEVVHNFFVVDNLKQKGAIFVDELHEVPDDSIVIFSAHGVSKAVQQEAEQRSLRVFDATCPLVTKVHLEVAAHAENSRDVILIGHHGHPEVEGTMGQYIKLSNKASAGGIYLVETEADVATLNVAQPEHIAYVTQTTLSVDDTLKVVAALKKRFPKITGPKKDDICYATQNRQDAVKALVKQVELLLVVGSPTSSNSNRLREIAEQYGINAYLIDRASDIEQDWLHNVQTIGLTAGASAPEELVREVVAHLSGLGVQSVIEQNGTSEKVTFSLPKSLQRAI